MKITVNLKYHTRKYHHVVLDVLRYVKSEGNDFYYLVLDPLQPNRTEEFYYESDTVLYEHPEFSLRDQGHPNRALGTLWLSESEVIPIPENNRDAKVFLSTKRWEASDFS